MIVSSVLYQVINLFSCAGENENESHTERNIQCGPEDLCSA